jgi:Putative metallopeptidase
MLHPIIQKSIAVLATTIFSIATSTTLTVATPLESISYQKTNLSTSQGGSIAKLVALIKKTKKSTPAKNNQIKVVYRETKSEDLMTKAILETFRKEKMFEIFSELITVQIKLPRQVTIEMKDCGFVNAFYQESTHSITFCNELTTSLAENFTKSGLSLEDSVEPVIYTIAFILYHEAGHMLIHELNLPITGREEDVADQFSAHAFLDWMNGDDVSATELGQKIVQSAVMWFDSSQDNLKDLATFMDEHSLNKQRALSLLCMLYVKNPDLYATNVVKLGFEPSRLRKCRQESQQITRSWDALLLPSMKK